MKVCFITGEYPPMQGGVADYTQKLAYALSQLEVTTLVLTSTRAQAEEKGQGITVFPNIEKWDFSAWLEIGRVLSRTASDIAHIQYQAAAYAMHPAINLLPFWIRRRYRVVTTFHDLREPYLFPKAGRLRHWANLALAKGSDAVIATTNEDALAINAKIGSSLLRVIPIGSNISPAAPATFDRAEWRARYGIGSGDILLCYFGLLNSSKGLETLLEALAQLPGMTMPRFKLLMIGAGVGVSDPTNIAYRERVLGLIHSLSLDEAVIWTRHLTPEDVSVHFLASDICVLPFKDGASFRRGTLMAALAHGMPIVSTRPAPLPQGCQEPPRLAHGENCLLVAPGDARALAEAIVTLAGSPELQRRLSQGARTLAEVFSWKAIAEETIKLYQTLLS